MAILKKTISFFLWLFGAENLPDKERGAGTGMGFWQWLFAPEALPELPETTGRPDGILSLIFSGDPLPQTPEPDESKRKGSFIRWIMSGDRLP